MHGVPDRRLTKAEWHDLMALFSELCELPAAERQRRLGSAKLATHVAAKLEHMLATLGQTLSLIDRPISERISLQRGWYEKHWVGRRLNEFRLDALLQEFGEADKSAARFKIEAFKPHWEQLRKQAVS